MIKRELTYKLELSEELANWLREIVRNPICCDFEYEDEKSREYRKEIFDALNLYLKEDIEKEKNDELQATVCCQ